MKVSPASNPRSSDAGMSLVEVMVAMAIFALGATTVILAMPERAGPLDVAALSLERAIDRVSDRALASGELTGLSLTDRGYMLVIWRGGVWQPLPKGDAFLGQGVSLRMAQPGEDARVQGGGGDAWPVITVDPTGIVTAQPLTLEGPGDAIRFDVSPSGTVERRAL